MTTYNIHGANITISTGMENYRYIKRIFMPFMESIPKLFREWYSNQYDCIAVYKNYGKIKNMILAPLLDKCISILKNSEIYSIDSNSFQRKYLTDHFDDLDDMVSEMMCKIAEIEGDQQAAAKYRRMRKNSRGRWVGGGFGMRSAIKSSIEAGMLNAATGLGHSVINTVGNIGSSIAASNQKSKVYEYYKIELSDCTKCTVLCVWYALMEAMNDEGGCEFDTVSKDDSEKAQAIVNNLQAIPNNQRLSYLLDALELDPYNSNVYKRIWIDYGDPSGDLKKMSIDFYTDLKEYIQGYCDNFSDDNDKRYCSSYNCSNNPQKAALSYENSVREALKKLKEFCDLRGILYTDTKYYNKYNDILSLADKLKRTVEGITYSTLEKAEAMRYDITLFYKYFKKCDITNKEETFEFMRNLPYRSKIFISSLDKRIDKEIELRSPELLFDNIHNIICNSKYINDIQNVFEIERIHEGIRTKRSAIDTYSGLGSNEIPLILLERGYGLMGGKGHAKSGFVVTNQNIKIYSNALLTKENVAFDLHNIRCVECLGKDEYELRFINTISGLCGTEGNVKNKSSHCFTLEMGSLSIENQNVMAELLTKLIFTVQNIEKSKLIQIDRIYKDSVVCTCGTYLLPNELSCPKCHRFMQTDGSFVEAIVCPVCHKHLKPLSKFCTGCGHSFAESEVTETNAENITLHKTEDSWIECGNCHKKIISTKKFCQYCGTPTNKSATKKNAITDKKAENTTADLVCKKCGSTIKSGKNFCSNCGTKINDREVKNNE